MNSIKRFYYRVALRNLTKKTILPLYLRKSKLTLQLKINLKQIINYEKARLILQKLEKTVCYKRGDKKNVLLYEKNGIYYPTKMLWRCIDEKRVFPKKKEFDARVANTKYNLYFINQKIKKFKYIRNKIKFRFFYFELKEKFTKFTRVKVKNKINLLHIRKKFKNIRSKKRNKLKLKHKNKKFNSKDIKNKNKKYNILYKKNINSRPKKKKIMQVKTLNEKLMGLTNKKLAYKKTTNFKILYKLNLLKLNQPRSLKKKIRKIRKKYKNRKYLD